MAKRGAKRRPIEADLDTYSGRVTARFAELCEGEDMAELARLLEIAAGRTIGRTTLYEWRSGSLSVPVDVYPAIAQVFGFTHTRDWLPD